jgi:hypothetical protein
VSGEAYVQQLPPLAPMPAAARTSTMGAEGMAFFKTTIPTNTLAWRLGLNGLANQLYVKSTLAPVPYNTSTYDLTQPGQMLVVPTYLNAGSQYFVGVVGNPGLNFTLDSRQQPVTTIPFNYTNSFSVTRLRLHHLSGAGARPTDRLADQRHTHCRGCSDVAVNLDNPSPMNSSTSPSPRRPDGLGDSITWCRRR